jgi:histidinol-phosphate aminotransferase
MQCSRRGFVAALSATSALAAYGLLGEMRPILGEDLPDARAALRPARILFNENPLGPSPKALAAIQQATAKFSRYPMAESAALESRLRAMHGLSLADPTNTLAIHPLPSAGGTTDLLIGVGSSEILKAVAWASCCHGGNIVEAHPGYSAIGGEAAQIPGVQVERRMIPLNPQQALDVEAMLNAVDKETRIVVLCNPNNPTGTTIPLAAIERMANAIPRSTVLLVDEAYIEFLPNHSACSAIELAKDRDNILVARTFSKIYGLAGLRIGYGLGATELIDRMRPYMLGRLSLSMAGVVAAEASLDDPPHLRAMLRLNASILESWKREFPKYGWSMPESHACFAWVKLGHDCSPLVEFLSQRQVLISGGQRWDMPGHVRISVGTEEENDRLLAGIRAFYA